MLEYPEIAVIARQLQKETAGKMVTAVLPPMKPHKFCWFNGDPAGITASEAAGLLVCLLLIAVLSAGFYLLYRLTLRSACRTLGITRPARKK